MKNDSEKNKMDFLNNIKNNERKLEILFFFFKFSNGT